MGSEMGKHNPSGYSITACTDTIVSVCVCVDEAVGI